MEVQNVKKLALFLVSKGLNGGRVARLVLGTPFQDGDGKLLWDAALAASGSDARQIVGVEEIYEILTELGRPLSEGYTSDRVVDLP